MYRDALSTDFGYLLPLYNISLQYKKLGTTAVELECLNLLVTVCMDILRARALDFGTFHIFQATKAQTRPCKCIYLSELLLLAYTEYGCH